jgi:uncharacterized membrane protein
MKPRLLLVCVLIAFVAGFCMGPPDLISQLTYGLISGALTALLVWISQKMLLKLKKGNRVIALISLLWAVLVPSLTLVAAYLMSR